MTAKLVILCILLQLYHASTQPEAPLQPTCNSCCQGPVGREGNPGIPGVPGSNGHPGNVGQKGDKGESLKGERGEVGDRGQKGDSGSRGLKGEQGLGGLRGSPGKMGPVGGPGSVGSTGLPGVKGQKGEIGQVEATPVSAFSAVRSSSFTPSSSNTPLPFEQFHTNVGDDFNLASGRFTCEVPGIYMFTYSLLTSSSSPYVQLMKDNTIINTVYHSDTSTGHDSLSNAAVLQLQAGEQVWLRCVHSGKVIYSSSSLYTSFSGVLLHEL